MHYLAKSIVSDSSAADPFLSLFALFCFVGILGGAVYATTLLAGAVRWIAGHFPNARRAELARIDADRERLNASLRSGVVVDTPASEQLPAVGVPTTDRSVAL